jgi:hypothetical protein
MAAMSAKSPVLIAVILLSLTIKVIQVHRRSENQTRTTVTVTSLIRQLGKMLRVTVYHFEPGRRPRESVGH